MFEERVDELALPLALDELVLEKVCLRGAFRAAFVSGLDLTLWVSAALMAAGAVLAVVFRPEPPQRRSRLTRENHRMSSPPDPHTEGPSSIAREVVPFLVPRSS
jgi:hypothetical protein